MPAWHQLVPMSGHVEESATARKLQLYATSIKTSVSTRLYDSYRWVDAAMQINYQDAMKTVDQFHGTSMCNVLKECMQFETKEHFYAMHTMVTWIGAHAFKHAEMCKHDDCNIKATECAGGIGLQGFMGTYEVEDSAAFNRHLTNEWRRESDYDFPNQNIQNLKKFQFRQGNPHEQPQQFRKRVYDSTDPELMHTSLYDYYEVVFLKECHNAMSFFTVFETLALIMYRYSRWQNTPLAIGPFEDRAPTIICRFPALLSHHFTMVPFMKHMCPALYIFHAYQPPVWNILFSCLPHWNIVSLFVDKHLLHTRSRHCYVLQLEERTDSGSLRSVGVDLPDHERHLKPTINNEDELRYLNDQNELIPCPHMEGIELYNQNRPLPFSYWQRFFQRQECISGKYKGSDFYADCPWPVQTMKPNIHGYPIPDPEWPRKIEYHLMFVQYV